MSDPPRPPPPRPPGGGAGTSGEAAPILSAPPRPGPPGPPQPRARPPPPRPGTEAVDNYTPGPQLQSVPPRPGAVPPRPGFGPPRPRPDGSVPPRPAPRRPSLSQNGTPSSDVSQSGAPPPPRPQPPRPGLGGPPRPQPALVPPRPDSAYPRPPGPPVPRPVPRGPPQPRPTGVDVDNGGVVGVRPRGPPPPRGGPRPPGRGPARRPSQLSQDGVLSHAEHPAEVSPRPPGPSGPPGPPGPPARDLPRPRPPGPQGPPRPPGPPAGVAGRPMPPRPSVLPRPLAPPNDNSLVPPPPPPVTDEVDQEDRGDVNEECPTELDGDDDETADDPDQHQSSITDEYTDETHPTPSEVEELTESIEDRSAPPGDDSTLLGTPTAPSPVVFINDANAHAQRAADAALEEQSTESRSRRSVKFSDMDDSALVVKDGPMGNHSTSSGSSADSSVASSPSHARSSSPAAADLGASSSSSSSSSISKRKTATSHSPPPITVSKEFYDNLHAELQAAQEQILQQVRTMASVMKTYRQELEQANIDTLVDLIRKPLSKPALSSPELSASSSSSSSQATVSTTAAAAVAAKEKARTTVTIPDDDGAATAPSSTANENEAAHGDNNSSSNDVDPSSSSTTTATTATTTQEATGDPSSSSSSFTPTTTSTANTNTNSNANSSEPADNDEFIPHDDSWKALMVVENKKMTWADLREALQLRNTVLRASLGHNGRARKQQEDILLKVDKELTQPKKIKDLTNLDSASKMLEAYFQHGEYLLLYRIAAYDELYNKALATFPPQLQAALTEVVNQYEQIRRRHLQQNIHALYQQEITLIHSLWAQKRTQLVQQEQLKASLLAETLEWGLQKEEEVYARYRHHEALDTLRGHYLDQVDTAMFHAYEKIYRRLQQEQEHVTTATGTTATTTTTNTRGVSLEKMYDQLNAIRRGTLVWKQQYSRRLEDRLHNIELVIDGYYMSFTEELMEELQTLHKVHTMATCYADNLTNHLTSLAIKLLDGGGLKRPDQDALNGFKTFHMDPKTRKPLLKLGTSIRTLAALADIPPDDTARLMTHLLHTTTKDRVKDTSIPRSHQALFG